MCTKNFFMKKIVLAVLLFSSLNYAATAQQQGFNKHKRHGDLSLKQLNLQPEQQQKIAGIRKEAQQKRKNLEANDKITLAEYRQKCAEIKQVQKQQIAAVLTTTQKAELEKIKAEKLNAHQQKMTARLNKMVTNLQLTEEQKNKIKTKQQETFAAIQQIRSNESLSAMQKQEQLKTLRANQKDYVKQILTQEQLQKLETLRKNKRKEVKR